MALSGKLAQKLYSPGWDRRHLAVSYRARRAGSARCSASLSRTLFRSESAFNPLVAVVEFDGDTEAFGTFAGSRVLVLDKSPTAHSVWRRGEVLTHGYWDMFGILPAISPPSAGRPACGTYGVYGVGGGNALALMATLYPGVKLYAWELDPVVLEAASYMSLMDLRADQLASISVGDALDESSVPPANAKFNGLVVDCFAGEDFPSAFRSADTWHSMKARLVEGGCLMLNLGGSTTPLPDAYFDVMEGLAESFGARQLWVHSGTGNLMVVAAERTIDWALVRERLPGELAHLTNTPWLNYPHFLLQQNR